MTVLDLGIFKIKPFDGSVQRVVLIGIFTEMYGSLAMDMKGIQGPGIRASNTGAQDLIYVAWSCS